MSPSENMDDYEDDGEVLHELKERRRHRSFLKVINKKRLSKFELDELMN